MSTFNLAHYPASNTEGKSKHILFKNTYIFMSCFIGLGISDHTDWELFTLLYPSFYPMNKSGPSYTGLEVWFENKWVKVPHLPGTIIVNQGEMLSRLSHGKFKAPVHRVNAKHDQARISLVSFWAPNYETLLPDPNAKSGRILAGEYYLSRNNMI